MSEIKIKNVFFSFFRVFQFLRKYSCRGSGRSINLLLVAYLGSSHIAYWQFMYKVGVIAVIVFVNTLLLLTKCRDTIAKFGINTSVCMDHTLLYFSTFLQLN